MFAPGAKVAAHWTIYHTTVVQATSLVHIDSEIDSTAIL